jgi:hypothetical protein
MSTPALIYLALSFIGLGVVAAKDGQPRTGKCSLWSAVLSTWIAISLLYWGGFFSQVHP